MDKQAVLLWTAIHELKLDVPVLRSEIDGDKVTLHLYGGQVVTWSPTPDPDPVTPPITARTTKPTVTRSGARPAPKAQGKKK